MGLSRREKVVFALFILSFILVTFLLYSFAVDKLKCFLIQFPVDPCEWCETVDKVVIGNKTYDVPECRCSLGCRVCHRIYSMYFNITIPEECLETFCPRETPPTYEETLEDLRKWVFDVYYFLLLVLVLALSLHYILVLYSKSKRGC